MKLFFLVLILPFSLQTFGQTKATEDSTTDLAPDVRNKIISDSQNGGSLDFWTPIKGHEYDGSLFEGGSHGKGNIYVTNKELAVIKWAFALTKRGIEKSDIVLLFQELKGRKIMDGDILLIDMGIKKATG